MLLKPQHAPGLCSTAHPTHNTVVFQLFLCITEWRFLFYCPTRKKLKSQCDQKRTRKHASRRVETEGGAAHGGTLLKYPCTLEVEDGSGAEAFLTCLKTKNNNTDFTGIKGEGRSLKALSPSKPQPRALQKPFERL